MVNSSRHYGGTCSPQHQGLCSPRRLLLYYIVLLEVSVHNNIKILKHFRNISNMYIKYFCKKIKALFYINRHSFHSLSQFQDILIKTFLWALLFCINNIFTCTVLSLWPCSACCVVNICLVLFIYILFVNCLISSVPAVTVSLELLSQEPYHYKLFYTLCFCIHCI